MIIGIGVDTVDVGRFRAQLDRAPKLVDRLFTPIERTVSLASLAARFAAKEALIKALGGSHDLGWQDLELVRGVERAPRFSRTPGLDRELARLSADRVHVSMTHDGEMATAFVIVERGFMPADGEVVS